MQREVFAFLLTFLATFFLLPQSVCMAQYPETPDSSGTAFFVTTNGMAVTNYHVIKDSRQTLLYDPHGGWSAIARVVATDPHNDLALLEVDRKSKPLQVTDSFSLKRGEEVIALGYPSPFIQGRQQKATFGRINADTGARDDIRFVQVDVPIQPGSSGSPLLNEKGEVVGVVTARLIGDYQNVGYAMKVDYLRPLLANIPNQASKESSASRSKPDIVNDSTESVVMVLGYRKVKPGRGDRGSYNTTPRDTSPQQKMDIAELQRHANDGHAWAQNNLGFRYQNGDGVPKDYKKAFEWYQKAAVQGYAFAQNKLAWLYSHGEGVPKNYRKAFEWWQKAANQGDATGQYNLGCLYEGGYGVLKDYRKAFEWFQKAADQGVADAMRAVGGYYRAGFGVSKDLRKAFEWLQKAVDQGDVPAMKLLGEMYFYGEGVIRDRKKGCDLLYQVADQGDQATIELYNRECAK